MVPHESPRNRTGENSHYQELGDRDSFVHIHLHRLAYGYFLQVQSAIVSEECQIPETGHRKASGLFRELSQIILPEIAFSGCLLLWMVTDSDTTLLEGSSVQAMMSHSSR